jgi:hypothetical protein
MLPRRVRARSHCRPPDLRLSEIRAIERNLWYGSPGSGGAAPRGSIPRSPSRRNQQQAAPLGANDVRRETKTTAVLTD